MCTHPRLGAGGQGCLYLMMPTELLERVVEACTTAMPRGAVARAQSRRDLTEWVDEEHSLQLPREHSPTTKPFMGFLGATGGGAATGLCHGHAPSAGGGRAGMPVLDNAGGTGGAGCGGVHHRNAARGGVVWRPQPDSEREKESERARERAREKREREKRERTYWEFSITVGLGHLPRTDSASPYLRVFLTASEACMVPAPKGLGTSHISNKQQWVYHQILYYNAPPFVHPARAERDSPSLPLFPPPPPHPLSLCLSLSLPLSPSLLSLPSPSPS
jgi:hypothetical protein